MHSETFELRTGSDRSTDITARVAEVVTNAGAADGLCSIFLPHATAGLALFETGAGSEDDVAETVDRLLPRDDRWRHTHGSVGHGADHVLPALISPSLMVPVVDGRLALGTWQSIVVVDPNVDNPVRTVRVGVLAG